MYGSSAHFASPQPIFCFSFSPFNFNIVVLQPLQYIYNAFGSINLEEESITRVDYRLFKKRCKISLLKFRI